ncbi:MAG: methylated-DNA--[protein]-cysteine S-methyltransferase [Gammaproteobacteria bacterium]|nr:methylated-DNA--[protein]-cysteine S-methyltransferase [Gammaproteobacteria bacterium]MBV8306049.1 methylated-DNA--[protein]-cysteine S-methyltransferase [Gammaproteobacteria bacterium]MBV8403177.1 methylated-DNA--[protein]-cysteine S-methyltransferase [Gammaproteobacteria bacterium]
MEPAARHRGRIDRRRARHAKPASGTTRVLQSESPALQAMWHVVCSIPRGQVSTYGAIARAAGFPGRARQAGFALRMAPAALRLPWHRVVGAGGRIVFAKSSAAYHEQARRLRAEGVRVSEGRIDPRALIDQA